MSCRNIPQRHFHFKPCEAIWRFRAAREAFCVRYPPRSRGFARPSESISMSLSSEVSTLRIDCQDRSCLKEEQGRGRGGDLKASFASTEKHKAGANGTSTLAYAQTRVQTLKKQTSKFTAARKKAQPETIRGIFHQSSLLSPQMPACLSRCRLQTLKACRYRELVHQSALSAVNTDRRRKGGGREMHGINVRTQGETAHQSCLSSA